jgi:hypothetical protein
MLEHSEQTPPLNAKRKENLEVGWQKQRSAEWIIEPVNRIVGGMSSNRYPPLIANTA